MGSIELQVFVALGVVLAAVLIALAVDFLKGSNERLRERNAALVEREKAAGQRASQVERMHAQMVELVEALKDAEQMRPVALSKPMVGARRTEVRVPEPSAVPLSSLGPMLPDARLVVETPTPMPESPIEVRVVRDESLLVSEDEVIEELPPCAGLVADPAAWTAKDRKTRRYVGEPAIAMWNAESAPELPDSGLPAEAPPWNEWIQPETPAEEPRVLEAETVEVVDEALIEAPTPAVAESNVVEMPRTVVTEPPTPAVRGLQVIPGGVYPPSVLSELLLSEDTFFGVTLSISVVDYVRLVAENGKESVEQVMSALETLVQSSGSAADLVCRISEDEFIVVCPGATGAVATSRVQLLSENLWDFQLRSLVSFAILFSWGASESGLMPNMPRILADSVDRAREQMLESRRSRRALTWASAKYGLQSSAG
jgi:GGDEF domain-containing protein